MKQIILFLAIFICYQTGAIAQEKIDNEGAITLDTATSLAPNAGTVEYRNGRFRGYDGIQWDDLDNAAFSPSSAYAWLGDTMAIPVNQWTKIPFDKVQFDIKGEFFAASPGAAFSAGSFFPEEPGLYQVTARCEYEILDYLPAMDVGGGTIPLESRSYVSIGVFTGRPHDEEPSPLDDFMYSQGNNLQIAFGADDNGVIGQPLNRNNAPNVSTIVEVHEGESISIYGFWYQASAVPGTGLMPLAVAHDPGGGGYREESPAPETMGPPPSIVDKSKVYVTIHKVHP